ncbi:MAG: hypothetical protein U0168_25610 [Nannocystaceae bacterium]
MLERAVGGGLLVLGAATGRDGLGTLALGVLPQLRQGAIGLARGLLRTLAHVAGALELVLGLPQRATGLAAVAAVLGDAALGLGLSRCRAGLGLLRARLGVARGLEPALGISDERRARRA